MMIIVFFKKLFRIPVVIDQDQYQDERRSKPRNERDETRRKLEDEFGKTMRVMAKLRKSDD